MKAVAQAYCGKNKPLSVSEVLARILFGDNYSKIETYTQYTKLVDYLSLLFHHWNKQKNISTIADDCTTKLFIKNNVNNKNNNNNNRV